MTEENIFLVKNVSFKMTGCKKNYKDPNHRLASLNGSAYSDSVYNQGDSCKLLTH